MMDPEQLAKEHEQLLQFLYQCPVGLASLGLDGSVRMLNAVGVQLLMPVAGTQLENLFDILGPFDGGLRELAEAEVPAGADLCRNRRVQLPAAGPRPEMWLSLTLLRLSNEVLLACFLDVTSVVSIEREAREAAESRALQAGKMEVVTSTLHDIGNAATGLGTRVARMVGGEDWPEIRSLGQLGDFLREHGAALEAALGPAKAAALSGFVGALSESLSKRAHSSVEETRKLAATVGHIQEILNIQRTQAGGGSTPRPEPVHPRDLLHDALAINEGGLRKREVQVQIEVGEGVGRIKVDRTRIVQVLVNLVKNACEAFDSVPGPDGGRFLRISLRAEEGWLHYVLRDNGPGFPPEQAASLFERGRSTKASGSGLGLAAARSIVESHGGSLNLQSDGPGCGATALLQLPLA